MAKPRFPSNDLGDIFVGSYKQYDLYVDTAGYITLYFENFSDPFGKDYSIHLWVSAGFEGNFIVDKEVKLIYAEGHEDEDHTDSDHAFKLARTKALLMGVTL